MECRAILIKRELMCRMGNNRIKDKKQLAIILSLLAFGVVSMAIIDGVISPPYAVKSACKAVIFGVIPITAMLVTGNRDFFSLLKPSKRGLLLSLSLGIALYAIIVGGYFLLRDVFDFSAVTASLTEGEGVTKENFPFVALYISVCNSFLEEFFFRGFAFLRLCRILDRRISYAVSALAFAVYHVAIMSGWFSPLLFALLLIGLYAGGVIFNRLDEATGDIFPSWVLHAFANLGINTVGLILFEII